MRLYVVTKFNPKDELWLIDGNEIITATICEIKITTDMKCYYELFCVKQKRTDDKLFRTKESLIESLK